MDDQDYNLNAEIAKEQTGDLPEGHKTEKEARHPLSEPPVWAVAANIVQEHLLGVEKELKRGTKHFRPGAKVYIVQEGWDENAEVVGHSRGGRRIKIWLRRAYLENFRVELVYSPAVIKRLTNYRSGWSNDNGREFVSWLGDEESKVKAEALAERLSSDEL